MPRDPFPDGDYAPYANSFFARQVHSLIFSKLWRMGPDGLEPDLAEAWEISKDFREFTVYLRRDVRFHDGRRVTAHDVAASLEAMHEQGFVLPALLDFDPIDDYTLIMQFNNPGTEYGVIGEFINWMAEYGFVVPRGLLEFPARDFSGLVGSGPFVSVEHVRDHRLALERNPAYYAEGLPYLDAVELLVVPEQATRLALFLTGQIHFLDYPIHGYSFLTEDERREIMGFAPDAEFGVQGLLPALWFDTQNPPFDDRRERLAVNRAINREEFSRFTWVGELQSTVPDALFPQWSTALDEPRSLRDWNAYDPEKAMQLLAEAGYADEFRTAISVPSIIAESWLMPAAVSRMLHDVGIETAVYQGDVETPADRGMKLNWVGTSRDLIGRDVVSFFNEYFAEGGRYNYSRTSLPFSIDYPVDRDTILEAQAYLQDQVFYIPLPAPIYYRQEWVEGPLAVELTDLGVTLQQIWLDE